MSETAISKAEEQAIREKYNHCLRSRGNAQNLLHLPKSGSESLCDRDTPRNTSFDQREWTVFPIGFTRICRECIRKHRER